MADDLSAQKARSLLLLALQAGVSKQVDLQRFYDR
jgi:L-asparaginase/Glu-tRNA(Gln) amidotransferase subunit D